MHMHSHMYAHTSTQTANLAFSQCISSLNSLGSAGLWSGQFPLSDIIMTMSTQVSFRIAPDGWGGAGGDLFSRWGSYISFSDLLQKRKKNPQEPECAQQNRLQNRFD